MMTLVTGCLNKKNIKASHCESYRAFQIPHGSFHRNKQFGYSLLELMVVMVVLGVVTSVAALSFGNFGAGAGEKALERLRLDVQLLSNESIIRSEVLGLAFHNTGYIFMRFNEDDESWEAIEKDRFIKPREFSDPLMVRMIIDEDELSLGESEPDEPQVISLPTGEVTPFAYQLESAAEDFIEVLEFDALGRVIKPDEAEEGETGENAASIS